MIAADAHHQTHRDSSGLAVMLFIVTEAMLFAAFFAAYFYLRGESPAWPPVAGIERPELPLVSFNTAILLISSVTMHWAALAIKRGEVSKLITGLRATLGLGVTFILIQAWEYAHLHFSIRDGVFGSTFYTLTGFHGAHVLVGLGLIAMVLNRALRGKVTPDRHTAVETVGYYWHFVDAVWLTLFLTVYVW